MIREHVVALHPNHLLELGLRTARKGGWESNRFIVPETQEGKRFGVPPGRYLMSHRDGAIIRTACQATLGGDLLLH